VARVEISLSVDGGAGGGLAGGCPVGGSLVDRCWYRRAEGSMGGEAW